MNKLNLPWNILSTAFLLLTLVLTSSLSFADCRLNRPIEIEGLELVTSTVNLRNIRFEKQPVSTRFKSITGEIRAELFGFETPQNNRWVMANLFGQHRFGFEVPVWEMNRCEDKVSWAGNSQVTPQGASHDGQIFWVPSTTERYLKGGFEVVIENQKIVGLKLNLPVYTETCDEIACYHEWTPANGQESLCVKSASLGSVTNETSSCSRQQVSKDPSS